MEMQNNKISNSRTYRKYSSFCRICMISTFDGSKQRQHVGTCLHQLMTKREFVKNFIQQNMKNLCCCIFAKTPFEYIYEIVGKELYICEICCLVIGPKIDSNYHSKDPNHHFIIDRIKKKKNIYPTGEKHQVILDKISVFEKYLLNLIPSTEVPILAPIINNNDLITSRMLNNSQTDYKKETDKSNTKNTISTVLDKNENSEDTFSVFNDSDTILLSKYDCVKIGLGQYEKIFKFVLFVEQEIDKLKTLFVFSEKLYESLKRINAINDGVKFNNVISCVYRLEELGTGILISSDTKFRMVVLIDPSIKPNEKFFEEFYERFSNIIKNNINDTYYIRHSKSRFCVLSELKSIYSIEISLASLGWNESPIDDGLSYFTFNSLNNIRLLKSIKKYSLFLEHTANRDMIARLCILIRYMAIEQSPLFYLDFWDIVIIAIYSIQSMGSEMGLCKIFRQFFCLLSGGMLLSDGSIPNPLDVSKKMEFELPECKKIELTYYCQYVLRLISSGRFSEIFIVN